MGDARVKVEKCIFVVETDTDHAMDSFSPCQTYNVNDTGVAKWQASGCSPVPIGTLGWKV